MNFIISQILGFIALIIVCIGYFFKNKSKFLILQIIANIFYASSFLCINVFVAGTITIVSTIRCIYLYFCNKHNFKYTIHFLPIFFAIYITLGIVFWDSILDIIPIITSILFTFGYYIKNHIIMRYVLLVPNILLVVYNILVTAYSNAVLDFIEAIVVVVSIIKFVREKKIEDKKAEKIAS